MQFHKQLYRHDPDNGVWGDCFRTAIACLLDLQPEEVPHVCDGGEGDDSDGTAMAAMRDWLAPRGLGLFSLVYEGGKVRHVLRTVGRMNPGLPYLLMGTSRTGVNHNVICQDDQIIWDPSLSDSGIIGPADDGYFWVNMLTVRPVQAKEAA